MLDRPKQSIVRALQSAHIPRISSGQPLGKPTSSSLLQTSVIQVQIAGLLIVLNFPEHGSSLVDRCRVDPGGVTSKATNVCCASPVSIHSPLET